MSVIDRRDLSGELRVLVTAIFLPLWNNYISRVTTFLFFQKEGRTLDLCMG